MQDQSARRGAPSRREVIAGAGASAVALTTGSGFAQRPVMASGTVFEDRSGTGRRLPGDPGIAGVLVSNGRDIAKTDPDGRWRLPVAEGDGLFVIKPPHWSTPTGPGGIPRFSYLHQPLGSPNAVAWRHRGVAPTGPLPASIDFPLVRREEPSCFEALLLSDTQPENETELGYLRDDIIAPLIGTEAAFAINHGDVVSDDLALYPRYLQLTGATGIPWHHCPGNHDMNSEAPEDATSRETWKRVFGPRHYAFQHAQATFIVLDNVHYFGYNPGAPRSGRYWGRIGESQLQFVRALLAHVPREHLVVLSMHIPLVSHQDAASPSDNTVDRRALLELLAGRPHTLSLSGHMHTTEHHYLGPDEGFGGAAPHHHHVLTAASGSWWCGPHDRRGIPCADSVDGSPNGLHVLSVDGNRYTTRFVPAAGRGAAQMRLAIDGPHRPAQTPVPAHLLESCEIVANVFDGGPRTTVTCTIAGAHALPMTRSATGDPFIAELLARPGAVRKPWVEAVPSTHLWTARLPAGLAAGAHRVTVRAVDEYGRQHVAHTVLEVAASASM
jgi:hypothetical protein